MVRGNAAERPPLERLHREQQIVKRLMPLVTVILVAGALKWTTAVIMPLVFALFLVAVFWPLQRYLEQRMARVPATLLTLLFFCCDWFVCRFFVAQYRVGRRKG
jgi:predicted PurR-regulated permease PerM